METFKIDYTDIILQDEGNGRGKIIISDTHGFNFSYYWGAMGGSLKEFILDISESYFIGKLSSASHGDIDMHATMKNVRKWWKEESGIAWYQFREEQKDLRIELNRIEKYTESEHSFVDKMCGLKNDVLLTNYGSKTDFDYALQALSCEPWHFIEYGEHRDHVWLKRLFPKLKEVLSKDLATA